MVKLIEDILNYIAMQEASSLLKNAEKMVGKHLLRMISINIADWLRLENKRDIWMKEGKRSKSKPLILNYNYPWCQNLKRLIEEDEFFSKTFSIEGNELYYSLHMSNEDRQKAKHLAGERYDPPLMR
ncbi:hypothetical protein [Acetivibrio straminisolvens]|jgi:hypothetical protein|uniref:Uncharacterized protein n=1 Tax=Acetivibrio straminisolvens JCM 21531 TaxID=1294263 RepID=W4VCM6_9FIRM|nr:hypothetical protein [Acetivibrio straminisolvens]GAE90921.1 hypothetical protein JCM21531_4582 [Acetivibrio straminisolvens JCM 21531]